MVFYYREGGWEILIHGPKKTSTPLSRPAEEFNPPSRGLRKVQPPLSQPSMYHVVNNLLPWICGVVLRGNYEGPYDKGVRGFSPGRKCYKLVLKRCLLSKKKLGMGEKTPTPPLLMKKKTSTPASISRPPLPVINDHSLSITVQAALYLYLSTGKNGPLYWLSSHWFLVLEVQVINVTQYPYS